jgi:cytoskeletal protein RodZ
LGDAAGVVAVQAETLDRHYLRQWAQALKLTTDLERLLSGEIKPKQT